MHETCVTEGNANRPRARQAMLAELFTQCCPHLPFSHWAHDPLASDRGLNEGFCGRAPPFYC
eukprot:6778641-Lingulodinium_polyedra.AAC.1